MCSRCDRRARAGAGGVRASRPEPDGPGRRVGQLLQPDRERPGQSRRVLPRWARPRRPGGAGQRGHEPGAAQHVRTSRRAVALADRPSGRHAQRRRDRRDQEGRRQGPGAAAAGHRGDHADRAGPGSRLGVRSPETARGARRLEGRRALARARRRAQVESGHRPGSRRALRRAVPTGSVAGGVGHARTERDRGARATVRGRRRAGDASVSGRARPRGARARRVCRAAHRARHDGPARGRPVSRLDVHRAHDRAHL